MTSDNDGEFVSSSGTVRPNQVPAACRTEERANNTAKGILVHCNNKKSVNVHRVSFNVTSLSSMSTPATATASPPPTNRDGRDGSRRRPSNNSRRSSLPQLPLYTPPPPYSVQDKRVSGFGIKSYVHDFYDDPAEDHFQSFQDDDFKYDVEPEIRWRGHCSGMYAVLGLTVMTIGAGMMAVGHLIPARETIVGQLTDAKVRWAVGFNENLVLCRYVGSAVFAVGVVFTVLRFWISVIRSHINDDELPLVTEKKLDITTDDNDKRTSPPPLPQAIKLQKDQRELHTVRIPITGSVENVQPEAGAIRLGFGDIS